MHQIETLIQTVRAFCQDLNLSALEQIVLLDLFILTLKLDVEDKAQLSLFIEVITYINSYYIDEFPIPMPEKQSDRNIFDNNSLSTLQEDVELIPFYIRKRKALLNDYYSHLLLIIARHQGAYEGAS